MASPARFQAPRPHGNSKAKATSSNTKPTARQRSLTEVLQSMELMQDTTSVLLAGLEPNWVKQNWSAVVLDSENTYTKLTETFDRMRKIEGLYTEIHVINPDSRDNINDLKRKIRDGTGPEGGSKSWDGVLLDYGLRANLALTPLFEELVNFVHETLPGVKLLFSSNNEDYIDALRRNLSIGHERVPLTKTALEAMNTPQ